MKIRNIKRFVLVSAMMLTSIFVSTSEVEALGINESEMYVDSYANSDVANPERYISEEEMDNPVVEVTEGVFIFVDENGNPEPIETGVGNVEQNGYASYTPADNDGNGKRYTSSVGIYTVDGQQAYCIEHNEDSPGDSNGDNNDGGVATSNQNIKDILYYGWGGQGNIFTSSEMNKGIVMTSLFLSEVYTGDAPGGDMQGDPKYKQLKDSVYNTNAPSSSMSFSDTALTTTVSGSTQTSQKTTFNADSENKVTINVPSNVTVYLDNDSDDAYEKSQKGGSLTIYGGNTVWFSAPSDYETDYSTGNMTGYIKPLNPLIYTNDDPDIQKLVSNPASNAPTISGFTVQFQDWTRTITVNHLDQYTGSLITKETYTKNQGESYTYYPRDDLKIGDLPYTPIPGTTPQSGTVGTSDITINFYYTAPVVKIGLEYVKIPTAPASEGLDVFVKLNMDDVYDGEIIDSVNPSFTIAIYEGSTKITSKELEAGTFNDANEVVLHIPSSFLKVDEMNNYTVKIEGFDSEDIVVTAKEIMIEGYTSSEETIVVNAENTSELEYQGVAGTYEEYDQAQQTAYEEFVIPNIRQLEPEKSGFGFEMPISFQYYFNDSSGMFTSEITPPELTMVVPNEIVDTTYIEYETNGVTSQVPFNSNTQSSSQENYHLPHVWCEGMSGELFSDEQVENGDERITEDLVNAGNKFYTPIWCDLGVYPITVTNNEPIGANEVNFEIEYELDVYAQMYGTVDSETIEQDHIIWKPVDLNNPFPNGNPDNWTDEDIAWLTSNNFVW